MERRSQIVIVADILEIAQTGCGQTRIMYGANLNYRRLKCYLNFLQSRGFVEATMRSRQTAYQTTTQGVTLLYHIRSVLMSLEHMGNEPASDRGRTDKL
jgi:predicted transcriptional regulator